MPKPNSVVILGVFVADTSYRAERLPKIGETLLGRSFVLGPGGKGSNQAVAAGRLGADVSFITRLGADAFGDMALVTWAEAGVKPAVRRDPESYTGAACIFIEDGTGDNAIIISPGAAAEIVPEDLDAEAGLISDAAVFVTQLEQPLAAAVRGLEIARANGVTTILNPAPAQPLDDAVLKLCDYLTPNETEIGQLTGIEVTDLDSVRAAADQLLARGVGAVVVTLGEKGALLHGHGRSVVVPAVAAGALVETTGAGDAFNGGFATALARGEDANVAVRYGCAAAGISVTRAGAARSMPTRAEVEAILASL
ncbi:ribokinase [Amaricoccus macauensis]|uniref:Ribokinase n=1 Tax=Amaricoccus macauensis TaxID=57001 RepID=A0A840SRG8_9RHOB|nr:ribokinase [Amaricoccus macauensis]MBB5223714.1 ribokinase [Amaricoccus macauensis]